MFSYKADLNALNADFDEPEAFISYLENVDIIEALGPLVVRDLLIDAYDGDDIRKTLQRLINESWEDYKENARFELAEAYLDL